MSNNRFSIKDALQFGWNSWKNNAGFFIKLIAAYCGWALVLGILQVIAILNGAQWLEWALRLALRLYSYIALIGFMVISIKYVRHQESHISDLYINYRYLFKYLGAQMLYLAIVVLGLALLIIPGVIWSVKYQYAFYFILDNDTGIVDAFKKSGEITRGAIWQLILFSGLFYAINILGFLCLFIGMAVSYPVTKVAYAHIYRQLLEREPLVG
ncbi:MAG: hypothetical protein ABIH39_04910 [Candidatus Margulisiibacteriota bacterium]